LPNGVKDLKTDKSRYPKLKKQTVANEKRVAAAIAQILLKAMAHCWRLPGAARICGPGSLLSILIKNELSSRTAR
jgi:hypothetical protein